MLFQVKLVAVSSQQKGIDRPWQEVQGVTMTPKQVAQNTVQDTLFHSPQNESPLSIQVSQLNAQAGLSDFQEKLSKID